VTTTFISVDEGADRKVHGVQRTDGADTVVQYLYVTAEPEVNTYSGAVAAAGTVSLATANDHLFQIMAGASLRVGIRRIRVWQYANASSTSILRYQLRRLTTAGTGGTSMVITAHDPADPAAGATMMTLPSVKGTEGGYFVQGNCSVLSTASSQPGPIIDLDFTRERTKAMWIAAGTSNGICLKSLDAVASATAHIWVEFVETAVSA
jgi:hypothetical protein